MAKNKFVKKIPFSDWFLVRGAEKRRAEAELTALERSQTLRGKVIVELLHRNAALKKRLDVWEGGPG